MTNEFTRFPGGRLRVHGEFSGQEFREDVALPLLSEFEFVEFDLGGSAGFSSGFLDEAFGELGLILGLSECRRRLKFVAPDDEEAVNIVWERIADASRESGRE